MPDGEGKVQQEAAEKVWEEVSRMLQEVVRRLPFSAALLDGKGRALAVSRGFRTLFRVPEGISVEGRSILVDAATRTQGTLAFFERAMAGETVPFSGVEFHSPFGARTITSGQLLPLCDSHGQVRYLWLVHEDETDRAAVEQTASRRGLEALARVAGRIAHTFGNRLAELMGQVSMARREAEEGTALAEMLNGAMASCRRAAAAAHELVTFAPDGGLVCERTDLAALLSELLETMPSHLFFELSADEDLWPCSCDPVQLAAAFQAVLENAVECSRAGDTVRVTLRNLELAGSAHEGLAPGRYVLVQFADEGGGMSGHVLSRAIQPYFTTKPGAAGLGLSTAALVAQAHGGKLSVDTQPGLGTRVGFYLPADSASASAQATGPTGLRILVMDDEPVVRVVTGRMLARLGFEATLSADGAEAVELYRRAQRDGRPYDLVILDLTVRDGMGGVEAMAAILAADPEAVGIAMSGYDLERNEQESRLPFVARLRKPFDLTKLEAVIREASVFRPVRGGSESR